MANNLRQRELAGLRAVVTGSSGGIGAAVALALAEGGARVLLHCRRSIAQAERVAQRIAAARDRQDASNAERHPKPAIIQADLADPPARARLVEEAWAALGGIDIWVNNAGADIVTPAERSRSYEHKLARLLAVDVTATILLSRDVGRRMQQAAPTRRTARAPVSGGLILNLGWDQAAVGMEGDAGELFAAAKGAVMAFSKSLALTLAPTVRVNCLAPGWIRTAWGERASKKWQDRVRRETPLGRWGTPEDVAAVARFLASPAAAYITGQVVYVNGGAVR